MLVRVAYVLKFLMVELRFKILCVRKTLSIRRVLRATCWELKTYVDFLVVVILNVLFNDAVLVEVTQI